jgi:MFS-type transporter involved in bile tolerance (Atg22 family)
MFIIMKEEKEERVLSRCMVLPAETRISDVLLCRPTSSRDEALGFVYHAVARGPLAFAVSAFFNPYLTTLARFHAAKDPPYEYVTWIGIPLLATSYVSAYSTLVAVLTTLLAPYIGAACDTSTHRRTLLVRFTIVAAIFAVLCIFINIDSWWLGGVFAGLALCFYDWSLTYVYAYLPEIGSTDQDRSKVSSFAILGSNSAQIVLMAALSGKTF